MFVKVVSKLCSILLLLVFAVVPLLVSCAPQPATPPVTEQPLVLGKEVIKIGYAGPAKMTVGQTLINGLQMAIDEINGAGGVLGTKLQLVVADTELTAVGATTAVEKLVLQDKVDCIMGGESTEGGTAIQMQAAKNRMLTFIQGTQLPAETNYKEDPEMYKHTFLFTPGPIDQVKMGMAFVDYMVPALKDSLGLTHINIGLIKDEDMWAQAVGPLIKDKVEQMSDATIVYDTSIAREANDFSVELTQLREKEAQFLYVLLGRPSTYPLVKQLRATQCPVAVGGFVMLATNTSDFISAVGVDNAAYTSSFAIFSHPIDARSKTMFDRYYRQYNQTASYHAPIGYLMVQYLARALQMTKSLNSDQLVKAVETIQIAPEEGWGGGPAVFGESHRLLYLGDYLSPYFFEYAPDGTNVFLWPDKFKNSPLLVPSYVVDYWKSKR